MKSLSTRRLMQLAAMAWSAAAASAAHGSASGPWAQLAHQDLVAIHDLIRDNHPGPVDPQNPAFRAWLSTGLAQSEKEAVAARNYADYRRALRRYVNGFRDIHVALNVVAPTGPGAWPGFIIGADEDGAAVVRASDETRIPEGSQLLACDGLKVEALLRDRIDPYFFNNDIPHWRRDFYNRLFFVPGQDEKRLKACQFTTPSGNATVPLQWRTISDSAFGLYSQKANATVELPPMGLRQVAGVWYIRIPTFGGYNGEQERKDLAALEADILKNAAALQRAPKVVIDMRHNNGGDSTWGDRLARALWGKALVDAVIGTVHAGEYVEFRASPANLAHLRAMAADPGANPEVRDYATRSITAMTEALTQGRPLAPVRENDPPPPAIAGMVNPVLGQVYVLTDGCGSACLDFLDVVLHIPGATQVGLPTLADAIYMESSGLLPLPSGLAEFAYPTKVIRGRLRKHNQSYEPKIRWHGGAMTEAAVSQWIATLP